MVAILAVEPAPVALVKADVALYNAVDGEAVKCIAHVLLHMRETRRGGNVGASDSAKLPPPNEPAPTNTSTLPALSGAFFASLGELSRWGRVVAVLAAPFGSGSVCGFCFVAVGCLVTSLSIYLSICW